MSEQIYGLTLQDCAEIMAQDTALRAEHGEAAYGPWLDAYLAQKGTDQNTWAHAWNAWWTRMESDPSGQLHAQFATYQQQATMAAHFADVPDASQDAKEGVTLDMYARIMARAAGGQDMQALVAQEGLDWAQWQRAQTAWNTAMGADVNHHLTTQYGQLYAKYTPGFQQQMQGQVAGIMAGHYAQREAGIPDEEEPEYTFDDMVREMEDPNPRTRWTAAHHVANQWDIGDKDDPALHAAAGRAGELAQECLERFDDITVSEAEALASDLRMFLSDGLYAAEHAEDLKGDVARALHRGQERLQVHQAAFEPIRGKAVPEKIKLQSAIQDYTSLIETLSDLLEGWDDAVPDEDDRRSPAASFGGGPSTAMAPSSSEGGFLDILKKLPIIGPLLKLLGL
ncbi:MAG: hypothetical protein KC613_18700 [Myxococcales bacterium]|nr:hypothetical protein [Myxococcales bacterium]